MKFSDPFNRVSRKQEKEYGILQHRLKESGIDSEKKALDVLRRSRNRFLELCLIVIAIFIATIVIWPQSFAIASVVVCSVLLWILLTMTRGQHLLRQFIQKELSADRSVR